jgi:hypothetical protein
MGTARAHNIRILLIIPTICTLCPSSISTNDNVNGIPALRNLRTRDLTLSEW